MKGSEWLDRYDNDDGQNDNHYKLRYFYRELYDYENLINWLRRNNDIEERKVLYACWLICFLCVVFFWEYFIFSLLVSFLVPCLGSSGFVLSFLGFAWFFCFSVSYLGSLVDFG